MNGTCGQCEYWLRNELLVTEGFCRRYPPVRTMISISTSYFGSNVDDSWVKVEKDRLSCGEFMVKRLPADD